LETGGEGIYQNFAEALQDKRAIAGHVANHFGVIERHNAFLARLVAWWQENLSLVEALAPDAQNQSGHAGNVYALRRILLASIAAQFPSPSGTNPPGADLVARSAPEGGRAGEPGNKGARGEGKTSGEGAHEQNLLSPYQVRGAFANYIDQLKADLKSIAASGWGPELIPDQEILASQFPEVLEELEQSRARLTELQALFAAADEEDFEDSDETGVLPSEEVKKLKAELKDLNTRAKLAKKEGEKGDWMAYTAEAAEIEKRLARHKALEQEAKTLKAGIRSTEKKQDELVEAARAKIGRDEARQVIVERLGCLLMESYRAYLRADQRACIAAIENLWNKYAVTAKQIEAARDAASAQLRGFLEALGYE
jgi:type I restriction enzyme M protein